MRKLLFRVWDPNTDRMIDTNVGIDKIHLYDYQGDGITEQEGLVIMQFTGLHDRNGKEVYEGDIVAATGNIVSIGTVAYNSQIASYHVKVGKSGFLLWPERGIELEVIGNIYENSELLS